MNKAMKKTMTILVCLWAVCLSQVARADFKYAETSRVTGGIMAGMLKFAGHFSKNANAPMVSTVYVKGNRLRRESADRSAEIIDLDGRRVIAIDNQKHTYSVATFDEIRQALQQAQQKMQQNMKEQKAQVTVNPKMDVTPTGKTRDILGQPTREVKVKFEMEMQAQGKTDDGTPQNASGTMTMASDMWVAPSVAGYHEIADFYKRMAKEIDWVPAAGFMVDPRAAKGMQELQKNSSQMQGLPLLQNVSMYLGGMPQGQAGTASGAQPQGGSQSGSQEALPATARLQPVTQPSRPSAPWVVSAVSEEKRRSKTSRRIKVHRALRRQVLDRVFQRLPTCLEPRIVYGYDHRGHVLFKRQPGSQPVRNPCRLYSSEGESGADSGREETLGVVGPTALRVMGRTVATCGFSSPPAAMLGIGTGRINRGGWRQEHGVNPSRRLPR